NELSRRAFRSGIGLGSWPLFETAERSSRECGFQWPRLQLSCRSWSSDTHIAPYREPYCPVATLPCGQPLPLSSPNLTVTLYALYLSIHLFLFLVLIPTSGQLCPESANRLAHTRSRWSQVCSACRVISAHLRSLLRVLSSRDALGLAL